jgi:hypothetical protein
LLGIAYIPTGFQIDTKFFYLAGLHFVAAIFFELAARKIISIGLLDTYGTLIVGVITGLVLVGTAFMARIKRESPAPVTAPMPSQPTA